MAAAYAFHLAKNHPFVDGNKRAALMCCGSFLRMNGWDLVSEGVDAADAIVAMVEGRLDKLQLAQWLHTHSRARPALELRDFVSALTADRLVEYVVGNLRGSPEDYRATLAEAAESLPVVDGLQGVIAELAEGGAMEHAALLTGAMCSLVAMYRIAEDMGYEW